MGVAAAGGSGSSKGARHPGLDVPPSRPSSDVVTCFCFCSQLVSLSEARLLLDEDDHLLEAVFDSWLRKRKSCVRPSLVPHLKQERRDGSTSGDAYVAFRRRREKMQTRKVSEAADQLISCRWSVPPWC